MLTLKIIKYNKWNNYHECRDEKGNVHRIDLVVDASLKVPEDAAEDNDKYIEWLTSLEGRTVTVDRLVPFELIAHDVKLLEEEPKTEHDPLDDVVSHTHPGGHWSPTCRLCTGETKEGGEKI